VPGRSRVSDSVWFGLATFFSGPGRDRLVLCLDEAEFPTLFPLPVGVSVQSLDRSIGAEFPVPGRKRIAWIDRLVLCLDENVLRRLKTYFTDTDRSYCNIISRDMTLVYWVASCTPGWDSSKPA
jgi:hypothetical protein